MLVLKRYGYTHGTDLYEMRLDAKMVSYINEELRKALVHPETAPELTAARLADIYDSNYDSDSESDLLFKSWNYDQTGETFECNASDWVSDYLNDLMWGSFVETIDGETDDNEDFVCEEPDPEVNED